MKNDLAVWEVIGFLFVTLAGTLLHFAYGKSGKNPIVGYFSPVNESTWEHLKLLFVPMVLYSMIEYLSIGKNDTGFLAAKSIGILVGMLFIIAVFYTYSGILGKNYLPLNILTFILGVAAAYLTSWKILHKVQMSSQTQVLAILILVLFAVCFVAFTNHAPHIALFKDPVTNQFGTPKLSF